MARVHVIGAGVPTPTRARFGSSFVVEVAGEQVMVDCGPATTYKLVRAGLWPTNIDYLFFTHHHFDHNVDYPCFLLCRWDQGAGREKRLQVFGPSPTETLTEGLIGPEGLFANDWKSRVNHPTGQKVYVNRGGTLPRRPPEVSARDVGPGEVYSAADWTVRAVTAPHVQPYLDCLAYRLDSPEGSVVFTGDTEPSGTVVDLARDADVMLCMCWDDQEAMERNGESPGVCGTTGAATMARDAEAKKLVLVHTGPRISSHGPMEKGIGDITRIYDGELVMAEEFLTFDV